MKKISIKPFLKFFYSIIFEVIVLVVLSLVYFLFGKEEAFIKIILDLFDNNDFKSILSPLVTFFSITCGAYLTVITLLSTSVLNISRDMLKTRLDEDLINVFLFGMFENILAALLCSIGSVLTDNILFDLVLIYIVLISLKSFIKFVVIIKMIFKTNMDLMAKNIDEEDEEKAELLDIFKRIEENTRK